MSILGKRLRSRLIAGLVLLAYGSAGVLGYGLHALWDCEHHGHGHAHPAGLLHTHHHGHDCHHHHGRGPEIASNDCQSQLLCADDCPICDFLVQAQSPRVLELDIPCVEVAELASSHVETSYDAPLLGLHPARGPPLG